MTTPWWLDVHSGSVQGVSTVVLVLITAWYAGATTYQLREPRRERNRARGRAAREADARAQGMQLRVDKLMELAKVPRQVAELGSWGAGDLGQLVAASVAATSAAAERAAVVLMRVEEIHDLVARMSRPSLHALERKQRVAELESRGREASEALAALRSELAAAKSRFDAWELEDARLLWRLRSPRAPSTAHE